MPAILSLGFLVFVTCWLSPPGNCPLDPSSSFHATPSVFGSMTEAFGQVPDRMSPSPLGSFLLVGFANQAHVGCRNPDSLHLFLLKSPATFSAREKRLIFPSWLRGHPPSPILCSPRRPRHPPSFGGEIRRGTPPMRSPLGFHARDGSPGPLAPPGAMAKVMNPCTKVFLPSCGSSGWLASTRRGVNGSVSSIFRKAMCGRFDVFLGDLASASIAARTALFSCLGALTGRARNCACRFRLLSDVDPGSWHVRHI